MASNSNLRVAVLWQDAVLADKLIPSGSPVVIGPELSNTLVIPDVAGIGDKHTLLVPAAGGYTLKLTPGMGGRIRRGDTQIPVEEVRSKGGEIAVGGTDWGVVNLGQLSVFFHFVDRSHMPRKPFWAAMEGSVLTAMLGAMVLHLGFLIASFAVWDEDPNLVSQELDERLAKYLLEMPELKEEEKEEGLDEDVGKKAGGEEGKFGEEDKKEKSKVPKRDGELVDKVTNIGIHKALSSNLIGQGPLKNVFGDKTGFDSRLNAAMAGAGDELVIGHGAGGMGLRGTGSGGGGEGFGRIHGMGRIDTGGGTGTRARLGGKAKRKATARVQRGAGSVAGFCKEADVLRVVTQRQGGINYCYEKELARNPELQGKVTMTWRIGLDGKVMAVIVENSTLGSKEVEGCMRRNIERWAFPKPEGGMCQIRFPFVFNAGL